MKQKEAIELLLAISVSCPLKTPKKGLFMAIRAEPEGYASIISLSIIGEPSHKCIKSIVQKRKLQMKETKDYLVIYGSGRMVSETNERNQSKN